MSSATVVAQGESPAAQQSPGYLFDMSVAGKPFGDALKGYGIYLNGGIYQDFFGYLNGRKQGTQGQGEYTLGADLDLKQMFGIEGAAIHISTDARSGENPSHFTGGGPHRRHAAWYAEESWRLSGASRGRATHSQIFAEEARWRQPQAHTGRVSDVEGDGVNGFGSGMRLVTRQP
jgi:carbohydrate-selective porin OprB